MDHLDDGSVEAGLETRLYQDLCGLSVLFAIAALSLTRLATALATLFATLGPFTVGLTAGTLAALISLLTLVPLLALVSLTALPAALTLILISLVVCHGHLLLASWPRGDY